MTTINDLVKVMHDAIDSGYRHFGVRSIDTKFYTLSVGDDVPDSYNWDHENDCSTYDTTGETLNGACAIKLKDWDMWLDGDDELAEALKRAIETSKIYCNDQTLLIGGRYDWEYGEDPDEIIISGAEVLAVIE